MPVLGLRCREREGTLGPLVWSETILDDAQLVLRQVRAALAEADVTGEVMVTGPASMPGVLTKGDVDLHLRVPTGQFDRVVGRLGGIYPPASVGSWAPTLAVFDVPAAGSAGLAVTPIGSPHDRRFTSSWRRLRTEPDLLGEYNALKTELFGTPDYETSKSAFFDRIAGLSTGGENRSAQSSPIDGRPA